MAVTHNKNFKSVIRAALSVGVGMGAIVAGAGLSASAQENAEVDNRRLDTITVTSTKREQTLQDVPVAVSVVSEDAIEKAQIMDINDLQTLVPSLAFQQSQNSSNTTFSIRGFGNGANNVGIEPSVGVFIDGVYRSRAAAQISDLPNLQRVEVLRGPQSTLFGKNASAGVISIVTREPQFESQGSVEGTVGNYNSVRLRGDVTGPLSETVAFSLAANMNTRDGYGENLVTGSKLNDRDRWGVRGELLFVPNDDLKIRLIADYDEIDELCCISGNLVNGPTAGAIAVTGGQLVPEDPFSYDTFVNFDPTNELENSGISLQVDYDLGFANLTSITAQRSSEDLSNIDGDFTSTGLLGQNIVFRDIDTFTQELRLTSTATDSKVDWMVGAYYFDETVDSANDLTFGDGFRPFLNAVTGGGAALAGIEGFVGVPAGTLGAAGQGMSDVFLQDNTAWSVFGTLDIHLSDRLTATVGINYTEDEKDAVGEALSTDVLSGLDLVQLGYTATLASLLGQNGVNISDPTSVGPFIQNNPAVYAQLQQAAVGVAQGAQNPFGALAPIQFVPPFLNYPNSIESGSTSDSDTSYTLRLAYDVSDNINVYGSYATGFKSSSWNLSRNSRPFAEDYTPSSTIVDPVTQQVVFQAVSSPITDAGLNLPNLTTGTRFAGPEEAEVFELGVKAKFENFAVNLAVFDQTIEGFQSNVFIGTGFALSNAGKQSSEGIEFDATWRPTEALTLTFAGTFLDPIYDSFPNSPSGDLSGARPSGVPKTNTSLTGNYDFEFAGMDAFVRADWARTSDSPWADDPNTDTAVRAAGYKRSSDVVNASFGFVTDNDIAITLWARNLLDEQYNMIAFPTTVQTGSFNGWASQPRTYGISVRKNF